MKNVIAGIVLLFAPFLKGQTVLNEPTLKRNSVYFEVIGYEALLYNVGVERIVLSAGKHKISTAVGFQYNRDDYAEFSLESSLSFLPQVSYLYGRKHHLELGAGASIKLKPFVVYPMRIGYRFQKPSGGLLFKIAFTPIYFPNLFFGSSILPCGSLALGYTF
ncbi:MAG: hypothetical protein DA405_11105 [Bacteroidetes bacterium]|nr:MAG: hypothetical protein DA405_11105 [Bacteroidota bacterium]